MNSPLQTEAAAEFAQDVLTGRERLAQQELALYQAEEAAAKQLHDVHESLLVSHQEQESKLAAIKVCRPRL